MSNVGGHVETRCGAPERLGVTRHEENGDVHVEIVEEMTRVRLRGCTCQGTKRMDMLTVDFERGDWGGNGKNRAGRRGSREDKYTMRK